MAKLVQMGKIMITANKKLKNAPGIRSKGFTLIELLIVIAVIGILAAALLVAIDPIDKVKQGRDTKVVNDVRSIYDGALRMYTQSADGTFPDDNDLAAIVAAGELKDEPTPPNADYGTAYNFASDATTGDLVAWGRVLSKVNRAKAGAIADVDSAWFVITGTEACYVDEGTTTPDAAFTCD